MHRSWNCLLKVLRESKRSFPIFHSIFQNSHWNKNGRVKLVLKKRKILLLHFLIIINVLDLAVISSIYSQFLKDMDISTRKSKTIAEHLSNKISPRSRQLSRTDGLNSLHWLLIAQFYYNTKTSNFIHIKASSY